MAFEELKEDLAEAEVSAKSYIEHSEEYIELKVFKILMGSVTAVVKIALVAALVLIALFMVSFGVSLGLNAVLESTYVGFIIVGSFYALMAIVFYIFRDKLNRPLLRKFSKYYFD